MSAAPQNQPIIIKRIKKGHGGGHHGGAWKVAYADFVTAMMALFLVLWLVAMLSIDTKKAVAEYFRSHTVFKGTEAGGATGFSTMIGGPVKIDAEEGGIKSRDKRFELIAAKLNKIVEDKLHEYREQVMIFTTSEGIRLELTERDMSPMFESGTAKLMPGGEEVISTLAEVLSEFPNAIAIEGHTDRSRYPGGNYTNWELAADRANVARRQLVSKGFDAAKITRVTSYADAVPLRDDPFDPANRRVSILVQPD
ncbi:MAG: OmpA family protein [Deltaproteobacteria bacterium]|nr:OmpA family protein [Deltaproteobacteria bacterium]